MISASRHGIDGGATAGSARIGFSTRARTLSVDTVS